jgi:hypothetical protein
MSSLWDLPMTSSRLGGSHSRLGLGLFLAAALLVPAWPGLAATVSRPGKIQFSNAEVLEGKISLTPGADLRLHIDGQQIRTLTLDQVREIRFAPAEEKLERKWRFLEAGQARKEFTGEPYLTRTLKATVFLSAGEKMEGHLYTTVFYLENRDQAQKVVVPAKQRGKEGEGADALKYPARITFDDAPAETEETIRLLVDGGVGLEAKSELAALPWGSLMTFRARATGAPGEYTLASPLGSQVFLAAQTGGRIVVGWPAEKDERFSTMVRTNMANNEDFYDDRKILGVYFDQPNADVYSVTMMRRTGKTTLDGDLTQPWRLVVQRWKFDDEAGKLLLAGRGFFFRGILKRGEAPPPVELTTKLWKITKTGSGWKAGEGVK